MSNIDVLRRWFDRVWHDEDYDAIDEMFAPDITDEGLMSKMQLDKGDMKELVMAVRSLIDNPRVTILSTLEQGEYASAVISVECEDHATSKTFTYTGQTTIRVRDGVIIESYNHYDFVAFFEALGRFPENTLALCMSGHQLR